MANWLYNKGFIDSQTDVRVIRLSWNGGFVVCANSLHLGSCMFNSRRGRFTNFKLFRPKAIKRKAINTNSCKDKKKHYKGKQLFTLADYLEAGKKINING